MKNHKKLVAPMAITVASFVLLFPFMAANAVDAPTLEKIKDKTKTSVTLKISHPDLEDDDVDIKVKIKNKKTKKTETREFTRDLDDDGETEIVIDNLKSDTKYSFKVRIKKQSKEKFSDYSVSDTAETKD